MPKLPTQREAARTALESIGWKYSAGGGNAWLMVSPNERIGIFLGQNGSTRSCARNAQGFAISRSRAIGSLEDNAETRVRKALAGAFARLESAS